MSYRSREEYRRLGFIHRWNAIAVLILLISGLLLYAEPLRGLIAPVRVPLKYMHVAAGLALAVWAVATARDWGSFLVRQGLHLGRRLNMVLTPLWLLAWTLSGLLMYFRGTVSFAVAGAATVAHDWLTWLAIPWIILHTAFRLAKVRRPAQRYELPEWLARPATRRGFVWGGLAIAGVWLVGRWLQSATFPGAELSDDGPPVDPKTLPGGGMKGRFRLYFINDTIPQFDPTTWSLTVGKKTYNWDEFQALPHTTMVRDFHCVTGWSVTSITWEGVLLADLLRDAGLPRSPALIFHSGDGEYTDSLSWSQATAEDVMLADRIDGKPLPAPQGGPVRLVVPEMYGYKSVKWVERVSPTTETNYLGFWEERGYDADAYLDR